MSKSVYFSIGTNLGDRLANLQKALSMLNEEMTVTAVSPVYATEPWGDTDQPEFLNVCAAAATDKTPSEVLDTIKAIEVKMGRVESHRWGPRLIDVDLILYGQDIVHEADLIVPHPYMAERAFVLAPLADINPSYVHPETGKSVQTMLANVDQSGIQRLNELPFRLMDAPGHTAV